MKYFLTIVLLVSYFAVTAQSFTENDLKTMAREINTQLKGTDLGNGITVRGSIAYNLRLVCQDYVDEF